MKKRVAVCFTLLFLIASTNSGLALADEGPNEIVLFSDSVTVDIPLACTDCNSAQGVEPPPETPPTIILRMTFTLDMGRYEDSDRFWARAESRGSLWGRYAEGGGFPCERIRMELDSTVAADMTYLFSVWPPTWGTREGSSDDTEAAGCSSTRATTFLQSAFGAIMASVSSHHESWVDKIQWRDSQGIWRDYANQEQGIIGRCSAFHGVGSVEGDCEIVSVSP
ncbi:MAG TPA: hypothetical protein VGB83_02495 [Actinomycetota bacterium]